MSAFVTVQQFRARYSADYLRQLLSKRGEELSEGAIDERVGLAVADAAAELRGWLKRLPVDRAPDAETLLVHSVKVAMYLLTLDRPGQEFEQIRNAYTDTIDFYKGLLPVDPTAAPPVDASSCSPDPVFTEDGFWGYT